MPRPWQELFPGQIPYQSRGWPQRYTPYQRGRRGVYRDAAKAVAKHVITAAVGTAGQTLITQFYTGRKRLRGTEREDLPHRPPKSLRVTPSILMADQTPFKRDALTAHTTPVEIPRGVATNYMDYVTINHKYFDDATVACNATDAMKWHTFKPFSMFDVDNSNSLRNSHQPNQRDNFAAMYDYYRVLSCTIKITMSNLETSTNNIIKAVTLRTKNTSDFTTVTGGFGRVAEMKRASPAIYMLGGDDNVHQYEYTLTPDMFQDDISLDQSEETWTPVAADPAVPRYFGIGYVAQPSAGQTFNTNLFYCAVEITLECQWRQYSQTLRVAQS